MNKDLYVSTDSEGVQHSASGPIQWILPPGDVPTQAAAGQTLALREPEALLEVLEELIYRAEPAAEVLVDVDGIVTVQSARLVERAPWNSETATRFALDCAEHVLANASESALPDGTKLMKVIADAREMLDDLELDPNHRLGYFARLGALRRLRRERVEVADLALVAMLKDEAKDLDALDDPAYASIIPVVDAVLGAIEALRHHALPRFFEAVGSRMEESEEAKSLDLEDPLRVPLPAQTTPFGPIMFGGGPSVLRYERSGIGARDAARHARIAARDQRGPDGEKDERIWQAGRLGELLKATS